MPEVKYKMVYHIMNHSYVHYLNESGYKSAQLTISNTFGHITGELTYSFSLNSRAFRSYKSYGCLPHTFRYKRLGITFYARFTRLYSGVLFNSWRIACQLYYISRIHIPPLYYFSATVCLSRPIYTREILN